MSLRRGEHSGRLRQVLVSRQLAHGEVIRGRLLCGNTDDDFQYRLAADDVWIDVIMHRSCNARL